eukprot:349110_1
MLLLQSCFVGRCFQVNIVFLEHESTTPLEVLVPFLIRMVETLYWGGVDMPIIIYIFYSILIAYPLVHNSRPWEFFMGYALLVTIFFLPSVWGYTICTTLDATTFLTLETSPRNWRSTFLYWPTCYIYSRVGSMSAKSKEEEKERKQQQLQQCSYNGKIYNCDSKASNLKTWNYNWNSSIRLGPRRFSNTMPIVSGGRRHRTVQ